MNRLRTLRSIVFPALMCMMTLVPSLAQSPQRFSYQALIRDASDVVLVSRSIGMQVSILQGSAIGPSVYTETHATATNEGGIVMIEIGGGTPVSGSMAAIDWSASTYYIKTETDPAGGTSYNISGIHQLISVPYAMYSGAGNFNDLENKPVIDGSETKVSSGPGIAVSGSGTTATPYMINFSIQSLTRDQRTAIASPYAGQIIWCNNCGPSGELQVYNGTAWTNWCGGAALASVPSITTTEASGVGPYTASSGGNVTSDGGAAVTARGVCWSTSPNPTVAGSKTTDGAGIGSFVSSVTGLTPLTTYYLRAYATNSTGTAYGNEISFTTTATTPSVSIDAASSITTTTATSGGNVTSDGGSAVTARGVCWSTSPNPTTANSKTTDGSGTGTFTSSLTGLSLATTYYVRAYATNGIGTAYGNQISFTTVSLPTVTTTTPYSVTSTSTWSGGNVTNDGGGALSDRGICISTSANPTTSDTKASNGAGGTGVFVNAFSSLTIGTIYHIRAYAINAAGTAYGEDKTFIALAVGDSWGGGKVAYIDATLIHGFIAANADKPVAFWGCNGTAISGADGQAIGTGNQNTIDIDAGCSTSGIAADVCANLVENGYSDWYLPSVLELWQLYYSRTEIGGFDAGVGVYYWSSSEYSATEAYRLTFNGGTYSWFSKANTYKVRPIRAF